MKKSTKILAVISAIVALALGVGMKLKSANDLAEYAKNNDCHWTWQGTAYGDDRDYICK